MPPIVAGGALVVPQGYLDKIKGISAGPCIDQAERARVEQIAMRAVMEAEVALGYLPEDVSGESRGYDIESKIPGAGRLRFIEVKGRAHGADTVTITKNEILAGLNKPDDFILAIVIVNKDQSCPKYVRRPFNKEPDFGAESVNYALRDILSKAEEPC